MYGMSLIRATYVRLHSDYYLKLLHNGAYEEIIKLLFPWIIRGKEKYVKWILRLKNKKSKRGNNRMKVYLSKQ